MAEQIGIVIDTESGGYARVLTERKGACGGCQSGHGGGCRTCITGAKFESRVANPINARTGDVVKINLRSQDFFKGAALLYLLPIVLLIAAALLGGWWAKQTGFPETSGAMIGAAAGAIIAVMALIRLGHSKWARTKLTPTIIRVLSSEKPLSESGKISHA